MIKSTTTQTHYCDRCEKELDSTNHFGFQRHVEHESGHNGDLYMSTEEKMELCRECGQLIKEFIKTKVSHKFNADGTIILVLKPERGY